MIITIALVYKLYDILFKYIIINLKYTIIKNMIYSIANKSISAVISTVKDVIDFSSTLLYDTFISGPITSLTYEKLSERLTGN